MKSLIAILFLLLSVGVEAGVIYAEDSGWYRELNGEHNPRNRNYVVQYCCGSYNNRNFFVFDLSGYDEITSAVLRAYMPDAPEYPHPGYFSANPFEIWSLFEVSTSITALTTDTSNPATYLDLGSGTNYGSAVVSASHAGNYVEVVLNAAALSSLSNAGGLWAVGGALTSPNTPGTQQLFGYSANPCCTFVPPELVVNEQSVAAPSSIVLHLSGLLCMTLAAKGRGKKLTNGKRAMSP